MKQHITTYDLDLLGGGEPYRKLFEWCEEKEYLSKQGTVPLLSIGQMIEFLDEKDKLLNYSSCFPEHWNFGSFDFGKFCDALWEAVKEILI